MIHTVYSGDVAADESVTSPDIKALQAFRVKDTNGGYSIVLAGSEAEARKGLGLPVKGKTDKD